MSPRAPIRSAALLAVALVLAASAGAAPPPPDREKGPNFVIPADTPANAQAQYKKALDAFREAKKPSAGQVKRINAAILEFKKVKEVAPKLAPIYYYLGLLRSWTMEYEKSRADLKQACDLNPGFHQAMVELAEVYWSLKQPDKALAECEKAIALEKRYGPAFVLRGVCRLKSGDAKGSLGDLEEGKKLGEEGLDHIIDMAKREVDGPKWEQTFKAETANYVVLTAVSQAFADDIAMHAELIFKTYGRIFTKIDKEKRKFPIIVYKDEADYHAQGGPEGAAGHYDPFLRKLYLYQNPEDKDTKLVLYHEGFHQYLHDYLENAPQWFNEGLGDFFGPSKYIPPRSGKPTVFNPGGMKLRPNPWRLHTIQQAIQAGKVRHFADLMLMSREEMYDESWVDIHYAQAWSIVYFLVRGDAPPGKEAGPHFKILGDYYKALRKGDGWDTAFVAAFGNDKAALDDLMRRWMKFTLELREEAD